MFLSYLQYYQLKWSGHSQAALDLIDSFISKYKRESEMMLDWRIVRSNLLPKSNGRKRKYYNQQGSMLYTSLPTDSEEYLDGLYRNYQDLIDEGNFENALTAINEIYDLIQKKKKISRLAGTLILKAEAYIVSCILFKFLFLKNNRKWDLIEMLFLFFKKRWYKVK